MISVLESGFGNVGSIINMMRHLGIEASRISDADEIRNADSLILPGVGAFDAGMSHLAKRGVIPALNHMVIERKRPILGICLGMQLLLDGSDEGALPGLGWIKGRSVRFAFDGHQQGLRIPNMGWHEVAVNRTSRLLDGIDSQMRFYFVHSYHAQCHDTADIAATAEYGHQFTAAVEHDNIFGVQFHPEKSHRFGMSLLRSFARLCTA